MNQVDAREEPQLDADFSTFLVLLSASKPNAQATKPWKSLTLRPSPLGSGAETGA